MGNLWRYSAGRRAVNRVNIYERTPGGVLQVEWWDHDGRHQVSTKTLTGHPLTAANKDGEKLAKHTADRMAAEQLRYRQALAGEVFGVRLERTLEDLLKAVHEDRGPEWSERYSYEQERYRLWWTERIGGSRLLSVISAPHVRRIVRDAAAEGDWTDTTQRHYYRYLVDCFAWAEIHGWIGQSPLRAIRLPKPRTKRELGYREAELLAILSALKEIDPRAWAIGEVCYATGRRVTAVRTLPASAVGRELVESEERMVIRFPAETDKVRTSGVVVLTRQAREAVEQCLQSASPWLFPGDAGTGPVPYKVLTEWLRAAEEKAEVPHLDYRSWHSFKRRMATDADNKRGASLQAGTREETMSNVYDQRDRLDLQVQAVRRLEERREGP